METEEKDWRKVQRQEERRGDRRKVWRKKKRMETGGKVMK